MMYAIESYWAGDWHPLARVVADGRNEALAAFLAFRERERDARPHIVAPPHKAIRAMPMEAAR